MRKLALARVPYQNNFLFSCRVYTPEEMCLFLSHPDLSRFQNFRLMKFMHALPAKRPKRVVVLCLHDDFTRFRTGMKFSPRCKV